MLIFSCSRRLRADALDVAGDQLDHFVGARPRDGQITGHDSCRITTIRSATAKACAITSGDEDDPDAAPPHPVYRLEPPAGLLHAERREGLVEQDELPAPVKRNRLSSMACRCPPERCSTLGGGEGMVVPPASSARRVSISISRSRRTGTPSTLRVSSRPMKKFVDHVEVGA